MLVLAGMEGRPWGCVRCRQRRHIAGADAESGTLFGASVDGEGTDFDEMRRHSISALPDCSTQYRRARLRNRLGETCYERLPKPFTKALVVALRGGNGCPGLRQVKSSLHGRCQPMEPACNADMEGNTGRQPIACHTSGHQSRGTAATWQPRAKKSAPAADKLI